MRSAAIVGLILSVSVAGAAVSARAQGAPMPAQGAPMPAQGAPASDAAAIQRLDAEIAQLERDMKAQAPILSKQAIEAKQDEIDRKRALRARLAGSPAPAAPGPAGALLDQTRAAELLQKAPGLAASSGRTFVGVTRIEYLEERGEGGWLVEFQWREAGQLHTGIAPFRRVARNQAEGWHFWDQGWGIITLAPDQTLESIKAKMKTARMGAFESAALGDVRTVMAGELTYQAENQGFFDLPECLVAPGNCIPGYRGPKMLSGQETQTERLGYRRVFHPGPKARPTPKASPSSVTTFAFTVTPITVGETGQRAFCGDDTGRICVTADGSAPRVVNGRCATPCEEVK